jgi:hypothetical protein
VFPSTPPFKRPRVVSEEDLNQQGLPCTARVAVGAPDKEADGQVRVFEYVGTASDWELLGSDILGDTVGKAGSAVALDESGSRIAVAYTGTAAGAVVRVFDWLQDQWTQVGADILNSNNNDVGATVALSSSGNRLLIGSPTSDAAGVDAGEAQVYELVDGTSWTSIGQTLLGSTPGGLFGSSLDFTSAGDRLAIGAPGVDDTTVGQVFIYQEQQQATTTTWEIVGQPLTTTQTGDGYGAAVSLSGDGSTVVIGAPKNDLNAGLVVAFSFSGSDWIQAGQTIFGDIVKLVGGETGTSIAVDSTGSRMVLGAPRIDSSKGRVRVYELLDGTASPTMEPTVEFVCVEPGKKCFKSDNECCQDKPKSNFRCLDGQCTTCLKTGGNCRKNDDCCTSKKKGQTTTCNRNSCQSCLRDKSSCKKSVECCSELCDSDSKKCVKSKARQRPSRSSKKKKKSRELRFKL